MPRTSRGMMFKALRLFFTRRAIAVLALLVELFFFCRAGQCGYR